MTRIDESSRNVIAKRPVDEILLWRFRGMSAFGQKQPVAGNALRRLAAANDLESTGRGLRRCRGDASRRLQIALLVLAFHSNIMRG